MPGIRKTNGEPPAIEVPETPERRRADSSGAAPAAMPGGWAIDALNEGWEVAYRAPDYNAARSVRVAPLVPRGRRGLAMTVRF